MKEEWRTAPDERYQVSSHGRIKGPRGIRKLFTDPKSGHQRFVLYIDGVAHTIQAHTWVALVFIGPKPGGTEVRHLDGDPANNHFTNLAWGTRSENMLDRVAHGMHHQKSKTKCKRGHDYTEENTYINPRGERSCRTCNRANERARYQARRSA
jgi:hypothetical protein